MQTVLHPAVANGGGERCPITTRPQPRINTAPWAGVENDPRLGLAQIGRIESSCRGVVRMDLDRQIALAVEKLEDQRKTRLGRMPAQQFLAASGNQFVQRRPRQWPVGDNRLTLRVIGDFPALGVIAFLADRLAQDRSQPAPAPQIAFEHRPKRERIERRHA